MTDPVGALRAHARTRRTGARREPLEHVVAVGAGKGGVGTSMVTALLGTAASRLAVRTLLVDLDEAMGTLHLLFGHSESGPGIDALRDGTGTIESLVRPVAPDLDLLSLGSPEPGRPGRRALGARLRGLFDAYPLVLIDAGARAETVLHACDLGAARLFCVANRDRLALATAYAVLKLKAERHPEVRAAVVGSRIVESDGRALHTMMREATRRFLASDVPYAGSIPSDETLVRLVDSGTSVAETPAETPAMLAADGLTRALCTRIFGSAPSGHVHALHRG